MSSSLTGSDDPSTRRGVVETHQTGFGYGPSRITLGDPRYRLRVSVSTPDVEIVLQPSCSFDGGSVAVPWLPDRCQEVGRKFIHCRIDVSKLDA